MTKVAIIGAGPAGLATARALKVAGLDFTVFEKNSNVGGIWDISAAGSPMYQSAHFISSKNQASSFFEGHPFPETAATYPSHEQVQAYLENFARNEHLLPHIKFGAQVSKSERLDDGRWQVAVGEASCIFDALVVCSGTLWDAVMPSFDGSFSGTIRHSVTHTNAADLRDKKVLVVSCGNSGADIACDAAREAKKAYLSLRRGHWFFPKFIMGKPTDAFLKTVPLCLPAWFNPPSLAALLETVVGRPENFGLPTPEHAPLESHPIINSEVLQHLGHGRLLPRGPVMKLEGSRVQFEGGEIDEVDEIICATGYRASLPFLNRGVVDYRGGVRPDLKVTAFHPTIPNLFFNGMMETDGGVFGLCDKIGTMLAKVICRSVVDSNFMERYRKEVNEADKLLGLQGNKIDSPRHIGYVNTDGLLRAIAHLRLLA